jgi:hypothetical protein
LPSLVGKARVLLLCVARPELLGARPDWPVTVQLGPLDPGEVEALLDVLDAPAAARVRIAPAAGGNPLYAVELVAFDLGTEAGALTRRTLMPAWRQKQPFPAFPDRAEPVR